MSDYPPGYNRDAHENAMGHNEPDQERPVSAEERRRMLVRLVLLANRWLRLEAER